jgi:ABC-type Mn2+/Zn2+ transport system permease subunit
MPLKAIGAFLFAPFLVFRVASLATDKRRKWVAAIGLFFATVLSLGAGTFLGSLAGFFLMSSLFGPWIAIGFLVGTTFSVVLTITFQVLVLNATCFLFLGLSSEEVVESLQRASE